MNRIKKYFWANITLIVSLFYYTDLIAIVEETDPEVRTYNFLSEIYTIDKIYKSMQGPQSVRKIYLTNPLDDEELLWVVGYKAVMVKEDGVTPASQEFMCHSNFNWDSKKHKKLFDWKKSVSNRLFTLSQGQFDIQFPKNFGIPVSSTESFQLSTQVLNLNQQDEINKVRHKVTISYIKDSDLTEPMKALFMKGANGMVLLEGEDGYYNIKKADGNMHGEGCMIGDLAGKRSIDDKFGRKFAGHWVVPPGKQINKTLVTKWMKLPYDTTVHYIAVHLHPFAEELELKDLTDNVTIFKSNVDASNGRIGIDRVDYFSSEEGVQLYKDHEYELISTYNNTSGEDQDSMAVMYLYVHDKDFEDTGI